MSQAIPSRMEEYLASREQSRRAELGIRVFAGLAALLCLIAAGLLVAPMNEIRREEQFVLSTDTVAGLPPDIELLTKTGTLRALAIDMAFIRLEELKEQNRFYELMQLSDWLCRLAPRYASVWSYAAWNMAYNISVCQYTPEARWLWVSNGIKALRNQGLRYNPNSITLYKELAWIFYHKIGDKLDDYHMEYKSELAVQMERILGEPPLALTKDEAVAQFRRIVEAPRDVEAWIESTPAAAKLVADLHAVGLAPDETLLYFVARHMRSYTDASRFATDAQSEEAAELIARRQAVLNSPTHAETLPVLLAALRSQVIRDPQKLNMDVDWMLKLMEDPPWMKRVEDPADRFCPIDWRTPYAHTLYWSTYGDMVTKGTLNINPADSMNAVRFIFFALETMAKAGDLMLEPNFEHPNRSFVQMLPDMRFIRHMHNAYLVYGEEQFGDDPRYVPGTSGPNYWPGHKNFLLTSIRQLYLEGGEENLRQAKEYYLYLRRFDTDEFGHEKPRYQMTFEDFIFANMAEALDTQANASAFIGNLLMRSMKNLSDGEVSSSVDHFQEARKWWNYYMRDTKTDRNTRRKLEPIGVMRRDVALQFMTAPPYGSGDFVGISILQKARLWASLDLVTRQAIYDEVIGFIRRQCELHDPPLDPRKVAPEPPGMAEHRENPERVLKELERYDPTVSSGERIKPEH